MGMDLKYPHCALGLEAITFVTQIEGWGKSPAKKYAGFFVQFLKLLSLALTIFAMSGENVGDHGSPQLPIFSCSQQCNACIFLLSFLGVELPFALTAFVLLCSILFRFAPFVSVFLAIAFFIICPTNRSHLPD